MALTGTKLKDLIRRNLAAGADSTDDALVDYICMQRHATFVKEADDALANTATQETPFGPEIQVASRVVSAAWRAAANVATDATDTVTITLKKTSSAGSSTTIASYVTSTAALVARVPKAFTMPNNTDQKLAVGDSLTVTVTKANAGKILTAGKLDVLIELAQ
jgi:hypothetical protein